MGRARTFDHDLAYQRYKYGVPVKHIARDFDVAVSTVYDAFSKIPKYRIERRSAAQEPFEPDWRDDCTFDDDWINPNYPSAKTPAMEVLDECAEIMAKKSRDYQNPRSTVKQADYYPSGIMSIVDLIQAKALRMRSVAEAMRDDQTYSQNFESIEDSAKDLINYAAFAVAYIRGAIDGQLQDRDIFNRQEVLYATD